MTIVQLVRPASAGMRRHITQLSAGLKRLGHAVLVAGAVEASWAEELRRAGIACAPLPLRSRPGPSDFRTARALRAAANTADLVHAHGLRAGMVAMLSGLPYAYTLHAYPAGVWRRLVERRVLRAARLVIAVSPSLAAYACSAGIALQRVHVVPTGVAPVNGVQAMTGVFPEGAAPRIGFLGRLVPEKGADLLLSAFVQVLRAHPDAFLAIAGDGPDAVRLRRLSQRLGIARRVLFVGRVTHQRPFLAALDVFVQPARREGQGVLAAEAAALGCRVVAARTGGLEDHLDGIAEFHAPGDPKALAGALERVLSSDPPEGVREIVYGRFGVDAQASATLAAYRGTQNRADLP